MNLNRTIKDPRFLLVFPPLQYRSDEIIRPDGTLALPYLDAALSAAGFHSEILDASIGTSNDRLEDTFYRKVPISESLVRVGMSPERILEEVRDFDVIAITSIFTQQTSRCFELGRLIKEAYPEKILITGGVNARSIKEQFLDNGFDFVFMSEGEKAIVAFANALHSGVPALAQIPGTAFRHDGKLVVNPTGEITRNIDEYPIPSWEKLPNDKYWEISRIWGGRQAWVDDDERHPTYAAIFTSRGCPFRCSYCHISKERGGEAGDIGSLRLHSLERVEQEFDKLKNLGVNYIYINDDSFLAKKKRVLSVLDKLRDYDFKLVDLNGVNIVHLFKQQGGRLVVDEELLEALYQAGFKKLALPFESGTQRLLDKYASAKWNIERCDVMDLIAKMNKIGIAAHGNFMIGYPDETLDELTNTFLLAQRAMDAGLITCGFFIVQPFPGTALFDQTIATGQLSRSSNWDEMGFTKESPFNHLEFDKEVLHYSWSLVWKLLNNETRIREYTEQVQRSASTG
jgi:radical SAM superfamily enzyme YgiQ (UPF0313 family)